MECSKCHRIWHVGGPQCPRCGAPPVEQPPPTTLEEMRHQGIEEPRARKVAESEPASDSGGVLNRRLTRRDFIVAALAGGAAATIAVVVPIAVGGNGKEGPAVVTEDDTAEPAAVVLTTYPRLRIASLSQLKQGEPIDFEYPLEGQQNFLVKLGLPANGGIGPEGDIVAFSYICTHMGCPLQGMYKDEHKILGPCPCHYSTFDLRNHGMVVLGQATQNIPQVTLAVEGDDIYATGVMGLIYGFHDNLAGVCATKEAS